MEFVADGLRWNSPVVVFLTCALLLSLERLAYAWIWQRPDAFCALVERARMGSPVKALERCFYLFKAIQVATFTLWCTYFGELHGWPRAELSPLALLAVALIVVGQVLNAAVFLKLGRVGVFYGNRFGHRVAWVEGFPFSLVDHPQYVGTLMTIWGVFLLLRYPFGDWIVLPALSTFYYACGMLAEAREPVLDDERLRGL
jgi:methylene-fatty-acyl-phospholipid synthase